MLLFQVLDAMIRNTDSLVKHSNILLQLVRFFNKVIVLLDFLF